MDKKEFLNFVTQGYQRIPVSKTLESFNIDPINIYEKISDESYSYLLESIEGGKNGADIRLLVYHLKII